MSLSQIDAKRESFRSLILVDSGRLFIQFPTNTLSLHLVYWICLDFWSVPHPDVFWYRLNDKGTQKNAPKKVLVTLFPYIFDVKPTWNIVYEYLKTKIFPRDSNILPQMNWASNIFDTQLQLLGVFGYH